MDLKEFREETLPPKEIYGFEWTQHNLDKIIRLFYWCSVNNAWEWFDFDTAFQVVECVLRKKLGFHLKLDKDEQIEFMKEKWDECHPTRMHLVRMLSAYLRMLPQNELNGIQDDVLYFEDSEEKTIEPELDCGVPWYDTDMLRRLMEDFSDFRDSLFKRLAITGGWGDSTYLQIKKRYNEIKKKKWKSTQYNEEIYFDKVMHLMHHHGKIFLDEIHETVPELRKKYA